MSTTPVAMDAEKGQVASCRRRTAALCVWRLLAFVSALAAFVVMITNEQSGERRRAEYHHSPAYVWLVVANGVGFVYALVTATLTPLSRSTTATRLLLLSDVAVASALLSAASAATAVAYVEEKGLSEAGWAPFCHSFGRYCAHTEGALVAAFHAWLYLAFCIVASVCQIQ